MIIRGSIGTTAALVFNLSVGHRARSRPYTGKETNGWRQAACSSKANRADGLQVRRHRQGDQALGG